MRKEDKIKKIRRSRRAVRIRNKIEAANTSPRLTVFRSNKHIYAQIIDDSKGKTLVSISEKEAANDKVNKVERAKLVGQKLAEKKVDPGQGSTAYDFDISRYAAGSYIVRAVFSDRVLTKKVIRK